MMVVKTIIFKIIYRGNCGCGTEEKIIRKIELTEEQTLDDLKEILIDNSFKWDDPHMYAFYLDNKPYSQNRSQEYSCDSEPDWITGQKANSTKTKLKEIGFEKKQKFLMIFDFGDDHRFEIKVENFGIADENKSYPVILEEIGKAPEQYEECEEE